MIIVGAGHCGGRAAQALRELGWAEAIELIGREVHPPYERPPLSKELLSGEKSAQQCWLRPAGADDADRITRRVAEVQAIDTHARTVRLSDGTQLAYEALLLATGGTLRDLRIPGAELPGVLGLRTLDDAAALQARLQAGHRLVIIGGGFIGLEVAASARALGCAVTVIEGAPRLLGRAVPAALADRVLALHQAQGVDLRLGQAPRTIERADAALAVELADGSRLPADIVLVGIGIEPAVALARKAGLAVNRGIVVADTLATSAAGVFAAGDVVEFPSPLSGEAIRQETWHNAETQAYVAAANMLSGQARYRSLAWFWSDQYDHQLQVCGEPALGVSAVQRDLADGALIVFYLDASARLVGASGWGRRSQVVKELKLARTLVDHGVRADAAALADPAVKLKSLLSA